MNAIRPGSPCPGIRRIVGEKSGIGFARARSDDPAALPSSRNEIHYHAVEITAILPPASERKLVSIAGYEAMPVIRVDVTILRLDIVSILNSAADLTI